MGAFTKMGLATLAFAVVHSAFATRSAKQSAAILVGAERRDAVYRLFYVGQSLLTVAALVIYSVRLPKRTVYRIEGTGAMLLRMGQIAGLLHLLAAARQVEIARLAGLTNHRAWRSGHQVPAGPFAQGPESLGDGTLRITGPFRWSRHPLNFSGIPIFWLTPHMTTRRLAFNIVSTVYFVLGSMHEEARLKDGYGSAYEAYRHSDIPFYWPSNPRTAPHEIVLNSSTSKDNMPTALTSFDGANRTVAIRSPIRRDLRRPA